MLTNLLIQFIKNPLTLFRYLSKGGKYRYALKQFSKHNIANASELSKQIIDNKVEMLSFNYKGEDIFMKNEYGAVYYITEGVKKVEHIVNCISIPDNATVIDAGGNVGLSSYFLKKKFPGAKIFIIEPGSDLLPIIEKNLKQWTKDITLIPKALGQKEGVVDFYFSKTSAQNNSMFLEAVTPLVIKEEIQKSTVACTTLEAIFSEFNISSVDLMKIDIQGGEYPVLSTSSHLLSQINSLLAEASFIADDTVKLCSLASNFFEYNQVIGGVYMGADILFSQTKIKE